MPFERERGYAGKREKERKKQREHERKREKETGVCVKTEPYIHAKEPYTDATELHFGENP